MGGARSAGCTASSATSRPSARWPRSCCPTSDRDAEFFRGCRAAFYAAGEPLLQRAQEAGVVRADASFDELIQMVSGIAKLSCAEPAQTERILDLALDGLRYQQPR